MSREKHNTPTNTNLHQPCKSVQDDADDIGYLLLLTGLSLDTVYPDDCEKIGQILYNAGYRKQEWISVDERLPDKGGRYIAHRKLYIGTSLVDIINYDPNYDGHTAWYFVDRDWGDCEVNGVTHWMPLPEAPKMKGGAE